MKCFGREVPNVVLAVHGGTGVARAEMTPELEKSIRQALQTAIKAGYERISEKGATSLDGVEAAVRSLEDAPEFNAGHGAVFSHNGYNELDAAIMEGATKRAGAIAAVRHIRNPISAARAVMERSEHVFLVGEGAEEFAKSVGIKMVQQEYFRTQYRWDELLRARAKDTGTENAAKAGAPHQWGTVGAIAIDRSGTVASATSTGGMVNKRFGRVGDTPVLGAGTYADNQSGAVSATGHGEFFIRVAVAHEILALMKYKGMPVGQAAKQVVGEQLGVLGGEGAVIALDPRGNLAMVRNCEGLYCGYVTSGGSVDVFLYDERQL